MEFGGFANAVLEYVFSLPRSIRGTVEAVVYSHGVETEQGITDRLARFTLKIESKSYFVYVFGEASTLALQEWRVIGWSVFMDGKIRMPTEKEMIWL